MNKTRKLCAVAAALCAVAFTACGGSNTGNDSGVHRVYGKRPVLNMPDGYHNVAYTCMAGSLFVLADGSSDNAAPGMFVGPPSDPRCLGVADGGTPHAARG